MSQTDLIRRALELFDSALEHPDRLMRVELLDSTILMLSEARRLSPVGSDLHRELTAQIDRVAEARGRDLAELSSVVAQLKLRLAPYLRGAQAAAEGAARAAARGAAGLPAELGRIATAAAVAAGAILLVVLLLRK